jgi:hypothetical protein
VTSPDPATITPLQAAQWWKAIAEQFAVIAAQASDYLLADDTILDSDAADEILGAITGARISADTAFGAHYRAARPELEKARQQTQAQASQYNRASQPQYM